MSKKLFVGGLSWDTKEDALRDFFAQAGNVVSAVVITDKYSGRSKGFGFVEMATEEEAQAAIDQLNGKELDGRAITVSEARPQVPRENNFNRSSSFGGGRDHNRRDRRSGGGGDRSY